MRMRRFLLQLTAVAGFAMLSCGWARAQATTSCPSGTYDMLDWMTLDSSLRGSNHLTGTANPIYTSIANNKFYWTKGLNGYPWDIQLYDNNFIYLWITEYAWSDPTTYKKFSYNTNMPFTPRCAKGGFPGSTIAVPNTSYDIYTSCSKYTRHSLGKAVNQVWGPYSMSFGGNLPSNLPTLVVSYRYSCDNTYSNCSDKEEFYLTQKYGLVQWVHYVLWNGKYQQQQKSVFNALNWGTATPNFACF
jgi:hypothetical protein